MSDRETTREKELRSNEFESNSNIECRYKCVYMYACFKLPPKSGQVFSVLEISSPMYCDYVCVCVCFNSCIAKNSVQILINIRGYSIFVNTRLFIIG